MHPYLENNMPFLHHDKFLPFIVCLRLLWIYGFDGNGYHPIKIDFICTGCAAFSDRSPERKTDFFKPQLIVIHYPSVFDRSVTSLCTLQSQNLTEDLLKQVPQEHRETLLEGQWI